MDSYEDSDTGLNLNGFTKVLGMDLKIEKKSARSFLDFERYNYKLTTNQYDWFIFPSDTKMGTLILNTKPSGSDYYSGRQYHGKLFLNLPNDLCKKVGSKQYKLVYLSEKEEMAEGRLERKDYLKKWGFWVLDTSGLMEKIFKTKEVFS